MKKIVIFALWVSLLIPFETMPEESIPACERQRSETVENGIMARIHWAEEYVVLFRGKLCKVTGPFEVFIKFQNGQWVMLYARDGSTVSWPNGPVTGYNKELTTLYPLPEVSMKPIAISIP